MSGASWTPATNGNSAIWDENKTRADLQRASILYDDATTTYDSATTFYDGYDPTTTTPEGEAGATWSSVSSTTAPWTGVAE